MKKSRKVLTEDRFLLCLIMIRAEVPEVKCQWSCHGQGDIYSASLEFESGYRYWVESMSVNRQAPLNPKLKHCEREKNPDLAM
jgi:hypothetical protein